MWRSLQSHDGYVVLVVLWVVLVVQPTRAHILEKNACNQPAPKFATLQRSNDTFSCAEVVYENCSVVKLSSTFSNGTTMIDARNLGIAAVSSFPAVSTVLLSENQVTTICEDSDAIVKMLDLSANGLSALDALSIPSSVTKLVLDTNSFKELNRDELPESVTNLSLRNNEIFVLPAFTFSDSLIGLDMSDNPIHDLSKWHMPPQLRHFGCVNCKIEKLSGIVFPPSGSLACLDLGENSIDSFELAQSKIPLVAELGFFNVAIASTSCRDANATLQIINSVAICVLPDALYNRKYVTTADVLGDSEPPDISLLPPPELTSSNWMLIAIIAGAILLVVVVGGAVGYLISRHRQLIHRFKVHTPDVRSNFRSVMEARTTALPSSNQTYFEWTLTTDSVTAEMDNEGDDTIVSSRRRGMTNTSNSSPKSVRSRSLAHLQNDIRIDQDMRHFRLLAEEIVRGKLIAKGGYGAVYKATFRDTIVVMKQLLPERARDPRMLNDFMDEIRMCASLDHPKIVTFLGFTFASLMDLSAVFEYMPNGDLATLLQDQLEQATRDPKARDAFCWFPSKDSKQGEFRCKSLLALDVAEALVYLHSFTSPKIHRDLKSNNVLLDHKWKAKLTDFGISRELSEDETMTAEIGTVSWIAPEVLRGDMYSEKADVYSFGVIMTELDTCRRPYSEGVPCEDHGGGIANHTNARIAVLVSAGKLRPSLSSNCPQSVRELAIKCLDTNPTKRPSALQLHFELRNLEVRKDNVSMSGQKANQLVSNPRRSHDRPTYRQKRQNLAKSRTVFVEDTDVAVLSRANLL